MRYRMHLCILAGMVHCVLVQVLLRDGMVHCVLVQVHTSLVWYTVSWSQVPLRDIGCICAS